MNLFSNLPSSRYMFYGGIAFMAVAALLAVVILIYHHVYKKKLDAAFDQEYGEDLYAGKKDRRKQRTS